MRGAQAIVHGGQVVGGEGEYAGAARGIGWSHQPHILAALDPLHHLVAERFDMSGDVGHTSFQHHGSRCIGHSKVVVGQRDDFETTGIVEEVVFVVGEACVVGAALHAGAA